MPKNWFEFSLDLIVIRLPFIAAALVIAWWCLFRISRVKWLRVVLVVCAIIIGLPLSLLFAQWSYELYMRVRASRLAVRIESYHASHAKYPVSLAEISGAEVNGPIYYQRDFDDPSVYSLWFGTGFGTVSEYDSKTRTWHGPQ